MMEGREKKAECVEEFYGYPLFEGSHYRSLSQKEIARLDKYSMNGEPSIRARLTYNIYRIAKRLSLH